NAGGEIATLTTCTVNGAVSTTFAAVAVMVVGCVLGGAAVVTLNVALVAPACICTDSGTTTVGGDPARFTVRPSVGAGLSRVTVPVAAPPALTNGGLIESAISVAGGNCNCI